MQDADSVNVFFSLHLPPPVLTTLTALQTRAADRLIPQRTEHLHLTLAYVPGVRAGLLAELTALLVRRSWPAVPIRLTGRVRHGSWELQKDPGYRHQNDLVQRDEQLRLGVEATPALLSTRAALFELLPAPPVEYWPHVTLGTSRRDVPLKLFDDMADDLAVPHDQLTSPSIELQQEISPVDFRVLARRPLPRTT